VKGSAMQRKGLIVFLGFVIAFATQLTGCATSTAQIISVEKVAQYVEAKTPDIGIFDANDADVRKEYGTVPGAVLLSSYNQYALSELPINKQQQLIFYCYNFLCTASDEAADRAIKAGYTQVWRMRDGITGWKDYQAKRSKPSGG
jgi:rhodanese-related sulfurtransferase